MDIEEKLIQLGIELFTDITPLGSYRPYIQVGNLLYLSGQGPSVKGVYTSHFGKVGDTVSKQQANEAARITAINLISILKLATGDLNRVKQIVSVHGYVNSIDTFGEQPYVINGASDLLVDVFGEKGIHSRCAMSVNSLPLNICVEVELIAEII